MQVLQLSKAGVFPDERSHGDSARRQAVNAPRLPDMAASGARGTVMSTTNTLPEIATTSEKAASARGWRRLLATGSAVAVGLAFAAKLVPTPWADLSGPWALIVNGAAAGIAGAIVADVVWLVRIDQWGKAIEPRAESKEPYCPVRFF
jgi:hypothetical protein